MAKPVPLAKSKAHMEGTAERRHWEVCFVGALSVTTYYGKYRVA